MDGNRVKYVLNYMRIQKRVTVRNAMTAAEDVSSVLLRVAIRGELVIMRADKLSQVLQKDTSAKLSQQLVTCPSPDGGVPVSFKLPDLGTSETEMMGLQVSETSVSSFFVFTRMSNLYSLTAKTYYVLIVTNY